MRRSPPWQRPAVFARQQSYPRGSDDIAEERRKGRRALPSRYPRGGLVHREFNVLALIKGSERYVFVFDDDSREELLGAFRDQAANPNLSFTWFDAALLTDKAREQARQAIAAEPRKLNVRSPIDEEESDRRPE